MEISYTLKTCWLGLVLIAATCKGVCTIAFGDSTEILISQLKNDFPEGHFCKKNLMFEIWVDQVLDLIENPQKVIDLHLDIQGTAFQKKVWKSLQKVTPGTTVSYAEIAKRIDNPKSVRAVANACANNKLAIAIPCHRIIGSDGRLRGYRWGINRKHSLLAKEVEITQQKES